MSLATLWKTRIWPPDAVRPRIEHGKSGSIRCALGIYVSMGRTTVAVTEIELGRRWIRFRLGHSSICECDECLPF